MLALVAAAPAQGATITVGSVRTDVSASTNLGSSSSLTVANLLVGSGGSAVSPVDGTIVRWHVTGAVGGPFYLRVLRPSGGGMIGAGRSAGAVPVGLGTQTFPVSLPIQSGDLIGLDTTSKDDQVGAILSPGSRIAVWVPPLSEGVVGFPVATAPDAEITFNAEVQPLPKVTGLSPANGSIAGGATVTLTGTDLSGASAVSFGGRPAALFPALSDTSLSAVVPKAAKPGPVDVTVTTAGGTSPPVPFTYIACRVPKLKGKSVRVARKALKKANCRVGKLSGRGPKVVKQGVKAGKIRPAGAKIGLKRGEG